MFRSSKPLKALQDLNCNNCTNSTLTSFRKKTCGFRNTIYNKSPYKCMYFIIKEHHTVIGDLYKNKDVFKKADFEEFEKRFKEL